ncbi:MAG: DUF542 domain-containing protein [Holophaga sp.]|jgi:regulator of cell morphogenesis and NO signaling
MESPPAFNEHTLLGQIAAVFPPSMRIFEAHGLDYWCGGQRPLGEACAGAGCPPGEVVGAIQELRLKDVTVYRDWTGDSLADLAAHLLTTHHAHARTELERLAPLMEQVTQVPNPELSDLRVHFTELRSHLESHLMHEEQIVFPYLLAMEAGEVPATCFGTVANPIRTMQEEHDQVGRLMRRMRDLSSDFTAPEGACESRRRLFKGLADLEADLRQHLHLENNVLFPKAEALEHSKIPECASPPCFLIEF